MCTDPEGDMVSGPPWKITSSMGFYTNKRCQSCFLAVKPGTYLTKIPIYAHAMVGYHCLSYIVLCPFNFCYHFDGFALI